MCVELSQARGGTFFNTVCNYGFCWQTSLASNYQSVW